MGLRFHKSITIAKGVKVNISKSGPSLSIGKSGMSLNIGKNGVTGNLGLPGTGLSYRKKLLDNPLKSKTKSSASVGNFKVDMDEMGNVIILDGKNKEITDTTKLRKIKATAEYKEEKERLDALRLEYVEQLVAKKQEENDAFIHISSLSANVLTEQDFQKIAITPYKKEVFQKPKPSIQTLKMELEKEAKEKVTGSFFTVNAAREKYVQENLDLRYEALLNEWEEEKNEFNQMQEQEEREYNSYKNVLNKKEEDIGTNIDSFIENLSLPVEIFVSYSYQDGCLMVDLDLPEIEHLPNVEYTVGAKGTIKEKNKTQATLKEEYVQVVLGLAVFLASHLFNQSLLIEKILISAYTQRRNKQGDVGNEYIYSIKFNREDMQGIDLSKVDPVEFTQRCENRMNITASNVMKIIIPFDEF